MKKYLFFIVFLQPLCAFKINRVILATDANPMYLDFWPHAARAWSQVVGIKPTLALIADESIKVDTTLGDVIRFDPIPGIPTSLQAQCIRMLLPAYFPNDFCILADIDLLPLQKSYFIDSVAPCPDNSFVVYRDKASEEYAARDFSPICYNAAKGSTFAEIFDLTHVDQIPQLIKQWHSIELGFFTDEPVLSAYLRAWEGAKTRLIKLGHGIDPSKRINKTKWHYDKKLLMTGFYIDACTLRPYQQFKRAIDTLLSDMCVKR